MQPHKVFFIAIFTFLICEVNTYAFATQIVATVNKKAITSQDVTSYQKLYNIIDGKFVTKSRAVENIINKELILKASSNLNINILNTEIDKSVEIYRKKYSNIFKSLAKNNMLKLFRTEIKISLITSKIAQALNSSSKSNITDGELKEALESLNLYNESYKLYIVQIKKSKTVARDEFINIRKKIISSEDSIKKVDYYNQEGKIGISDLGWLNRSDIDINLYQKLIKLNPGGASAIIYSNNKSFFYFLSKKVMSSNINTTSIKQAINHIQKQKILKLNSKFFEKLKKDSYIEIY